MDKRVPWVSGRTDGWMDRWMDRQGNRVPERLMTYLGLHSLSAEEGSTLRTQPPAASHNTKFLRMKLSVFLTV